MFSHILVAQGVQPYLGGTCKVCAESTYTNLKTCHNGYLLLGSSGGSGRRNLPFAIHHVHQEVNNL